MKVTMGSLFDGIGGFTLAGIRNNIIPIWASEIEKFPIEVTKKHFPEMEHVGDITKLDGAKLKSVDIITGGSPCQDISIAGARKGLSGERSGLFTEQIRIIKEMRKESIKINGTDGIIRPRYFVWENVFGVFSSQKGRDFKRVLEEIISVKQEGICIPGPKDWKWKSVGDILGDDYEIAYRTFNAKYFGVPQNRRRIFIVADFNGHSAKEILFVD